MSATKEVTVKIAVDGKGVKTGMDNVTSYFKKFNDQALGKVGKALSIFAPSVKDAFENARDGLSQLTRAFGTASLRWGLLAAPIVAIPAAFAMALKHAKEISAAARQLDIAVPDAARLLKAGDTSGVDVTSLATRLRESRSKALQGSKEEVEAFARIGITLKDIERLNAGELLEKIAAATASGAINSTNFADAVKVLGREAREAIPSLKKLNDELQANGSGDEANSSTTKSITALDRAAKRVSSQAKWTTYGVASNIAAGALDLFGYIAGSAVYSTARLGKKLHGGGPNEFFDKTMDYGEGLAGQSLAEHFWTSNMTNMDRIEKRLQDRQAVKALRDEQRRNENNAYIDDLYARMYERGSGSDGEKVKPEKDVSFRGMSHQRASDSLARIGGIVGLQDRTMHMQAQQIQKLDIQISELRKINYALTGSDESISSSFISASSYGMLGNTLP